MLVGLIQPLQGDAATSTQVYHSGKTAARHSIPANPTTESCLPWWTGHGGNGDHLRDILGAAWLVRQPTLQQPYSPVFQRCGRNTAVSQSRAISQLARHTPGHLCSWWLLGRYAAISNKQQRTPGDRHPERGNARDARQRLVTVHSYNVLCLLRQRGDHVLQRQ